MYNSYVNFLFCLLITSISFSQEPKNTYTAFGVFPEKANDSLYAKLKSTKNMLERMHVLELLANEQIRLGTTDSILYYGRLLRDESVKNNIPLEKEHYFLSKSYLFLGKGSYQKGLFEDASKYYIKGIELIKNKEENTFYYEFYLGLGSVYLQKNDLKKALQYLDVCKHQNKNVYIKTLANSYLGNYYLNQKEIQKAKNHYTKASLYLKEYNSPKLALTIKNSLGNIAAYEGDLETALFYFEEVKKSALTHSFYDIYVDSILQIGKIYFQQKEYQASEMILSMAYANSIQWNRLELQKRILFWLRKLYVSKNDYKNAYSLTTQYISVSNEINKKQNSKLIKDLEFKYETLKKEKEIFTLKETQLIKENEIQKQKTTKNAFLIGFLIILIPIIALLYVYYQKLQAQSKLTAIQKEVNQQQISSLMKEQELKLIKASLKGQSEERSRISRELHDSIGGNLAGIKLQLTNLEDSTSLKKTILQELDATYNQVRDISHDLVREKFNTNIFTAVIEEYIATLSIGLRQEITFIPHPKDQINAISNTLQVELFKIIQELLTNALKHANASTIDIHLDIFQNELQLLFEDDGIGFDIHKPNEGIGLQNIKTRVQTLNATLHIDTALKRGTVIKIEIPIT